MDIHSGIPTIDVARDSRATKIKVIGEGLERFGFVILVNHGIDAAVLRNAYSVSERAFALSETVKRRYECETDGRHTGFASFGVEHAKDVPVGDLKEFWHIRRAVTPDKLRFPEEIPEFGSVMFDLYDRLYAVAAEQLGYIEEHLGLATGALVDGVVRGDSLLRLLYYPELLGNEAGLRSAAHEDINLITLLVSATSAGLEILTREGVWMPVNNPPDAIILNAGDMLQACTGGHLRSTTHRVVNGSGKVRYSIPFFVHPRPEVVLVENPRLTAGEYLLQRLREIGLLK